MNRSFTARDQIFIASIISILLVLLLASCGNKEVPLSVPAGASAGDMVDLESCTYKEGDVEYAADCGTLVVPENWENSDSRLIALPVIRIPSTGENPVEPIFRLGGGPGNTNMSFSRVSSFIKDHDLVMVGYRGVDGSSNLQCPGVVKAMKGKSGDLLSEESIVYIGEAFKSCAQRLLAEGVDLDGYTIPNIIDDIEATRIGFNYERVNLLSFSFGTRVAMLYAWMYPDSIHRSAMISVNPPGHLAWEPDMLDWQLTHDAECSDRTEDLAETIRSVAHNMPRRWLFFPIDPGRVRFFTHFFLWYRGGLTGQDAAMIYEVYLAAEKGDPSGLALISLMYDLVNPAAMMNWGQSAVIVLSTDFDATRDYFTDMNPPGSILGAPQSELAWSPLQYSQWPATLIPRELRQVQTSDVETLLVSGNVDATTPAQYATDELLPSLSNGQQIILSEFGHVDDVWNLQPEATMYLLSNFYDSGMVDDSHFTYQPMEFDVGLGFPQIAKIMVVIILLVIAVPIVVVWVLIKRRRRKTISAI